MSHLTDGYLRDLGFLLKEEWKSSERTLESQNRAQKCHETGYNRAFRRVISLMIQQAEAFGLPLSAINLEGIDREKHFGC